MLQFYMPKGKQEYAWKRQWMPRGGSLARDDDGFVHDPNPQWCNLIPNDAVAIEKLRDHPCLVFLGEPGLGKSRALLDAFEESKTGRDAGQHLLINLGEFSSEEALLKRIFSSAPFKKWKSTKKPFWLFLDSFDECLIRIDSVANLLAGAFADLPNVDNFHLRVASRPTEWPTIFEDDLKKVWSKNEHLTVHELVPLTRDQILLAAKQNQFDADAFINAVIEREIGPFAEKPLTLELLFRIWADEKRFPKSQAEIYRRGCKLLSQELNKRRLTAQLRPKLSAETRLSLASRIAAAGVFGKRPLIHPVDDTHESSESLLIPELEGTDRFDGKTITINGEMIRETLRTGLFAPRDPENLRWSHPTIADFMASEYLLGHDLSDEQLSDLLINSVDEKKQIIPQLREVAALMAPHKPLIMEKLINEEPDVLLRGDIDSSSDDIKARVLESLLLTRGEGRHNYDWTGLRRRYRKLSHPGLEALVLKKIQDPSFPPRAREEAVTFAEQCELVNLFPMILQVALDAGADASLRETAAIVISRAQDDELVRGLLPLALGTGGPDPHQELKGIAIRACWPRFMSADQLYGCLVAPRTDVVSNYMTLFGGYLLERISRDDLPHGLAWIAKLPSQQHSQDHLLRFAVGILEKSLPHLDDPGMTDLVAQALLTRSRAHDFHGLGPNLIAKSLSENPPLRRGIVDAMLNHAEDSHIDVLGLTGWGGVRLLDLDDLPWVIERLAREAAPKKQAILSSVIVRMFNPEKVAQIDQLVQLTELIEIFKEKMARWIKPVALDSPEATQGRALIADQLQTEQHRRNNTPQPLPIPPLERTKEALGNLPNDAEAFYKAVFWLSLNKFGRPGAENGNVDVRKLEGWKTCGPETQQSLVSAALDYLHKNQVKDENWIIKRDTLFWPALAAARAASLLNTESPQDFQDLSPDAWRQWFPVMLRHNGQASREIFAPLLERAIEVLGGAAINMITEELRLELQHEDNFSLLSKIPKKVDPRITKSVLGIMEAGITNFSPFQQTLDFLARADVATANDFARNFLRIGDLKNDQIRRKCVSAAEILLKQGNDSDWELIRTLIRKENSFGVGLCASLQSDGFPNYEIYLKVLSVQSMGSVLGMDDGAVSSLRGPGTHRR